MQDILLEPYGGQILHLPEALIKPFDLVAFIDLEIFQQIGQIRHGKYFFQ